MRCYEAPRDEMAAVVAKCAARLLALDGKEDGYAAFWLPHLHGNPQHILGAYLPYLGYEALTPLGGRGIGDVPRL